jgi:hypothetical protein
MEFAMKTKPRDVTVTELFVAAAAAARLESRRYWTANDKRFPQQELSFWPPTPAADTTDVDLLRERRRRRRQKGR